VRAGGEPAQQGGAEEPVLDDPAHRCGRLGVVGGFAVVEMEEERARAPVVAGIGDPDIADRLGFGGNLVPDAERGEQALAGIGDSGGAPVEARLGQGSERNAVDEGGQKTRFAGRQGEKAAVEARAYDGEVERTTIHGP